MSQNVENYRKQYMEAIINHHYEKKEPKIQSVPKKRKWKELYLTEGSRTTYNNYLCDCQNCDANCSNYFREKIPKLQSQKPRTMKPIVCDLCDYKPKSMAYLKRHMEAHHKYNHRKSVKQRVEKAEMVERSLKVEVFKCPIENCNFVSTRKFIGIRNHLPIHFKDEIRQNAKPKTDPIISQERISSCLANWVCSIPRLEAKGELAHHYGIFHCLVDKFFREYVTERIFTEATNPQQNPCIFCDLHFGTEKELIDHITIEHLYEQILEEMIDKIHLKTMTKSEECFKEFKCPFCNKKFYLFASQSTTSSAFKTVIKHCGLDHGFTLYYIFKTQALEKPAQLPTQHQEIKTVEQIIETQVLEEKTEHSVNIKEPLEATGPKEQPLQELAVLNFDTFEENSDSGNIGFDDEMIDVMASTLYSMYQAGLVEHSIL